jgi:hypothetical protein
MPGKVAVTIDKRDFDAAIFDLDGVLTDTAGIHAAAWKIVFDAFLKRRADRQGLQFRPFEVDVDYLAYVDGLPRYDGVRTFLRGIILPEGSEHDLEDAETVRAMYLIEHGLRVGADLFINQRQSRGLGADTIFDGGTNHPAGIGDKVRQDERALSSERLLSLHSARDIGPYCNEPRPQLRDISGMG